MHSTKKSSYLLTLVYFLLILLSCGQKSNQEVSKNEPHTSFELPNNSIISLYDAFGEKKDNLIKDFGFSCLVKYNEKTILFDGGTNADIFKNNVEALNIDLGSIDFVVASHAHFDHINGFDHLLKVNPKVKIYFPFDLFWGANIPFDISGKDSTAVNSLDKKMQYFNGDYKNYHFKQTGRFWNANIEFIKENTVIAPGITLISSSSEYMGYFNKYPRLDKCDDCEAQNAKFSGLKEISLSLKSETGEVVIVGCSHSTVQKIITDTKSFTNNPIAMVYGGYHLLPYDKDALLNLTNHIKNELEVKKVAPAHCTGHLAFKILLDAYQENYMFAGLGEITSF